MYYSTDYNSPLGEMRIVSDGESLSGIWFLNQKNFLSSIEGELMENGDLTIFEKVINWLDAYFDGKNPEIDFELNPEGTEFRKKVWAILSEIPYGETMTYGEIASMISPTMSAQAVGGAVGANPISIVIPCHRVLGKNGQLTGYAAGVDKKIELLNLEKIIFKNNE
ncbi:MAG: methylated-DNA--[protein]-cysteine S-methyltransferase [Methanobrevibacter sp.]|uniref:methylated-DNA--[protein]-cysteine S-methyltransferase n=1 Tax=Methanobrevibacter sp. TaxID=66852 RepID=UPI001B527E17|nr:methylated-DNA--[protein]-cysteine S-methyltransferase [Methanobrevibacter sp.]